MLHEITANADSGGRSAKSDIAPLEQLDHSAQEMRPLVSHVLRLKADSPPRAYLAGVHVSSAALVDLFLEELLRCLHTSGRDASPGADAARKNRHLDVEQQPGMPSITATPSCNYVMSINYGAGAAMPWT